MICRWFCFRRRIRITKQIEEKKIVIGHWRIHVQSDSGPSGKGWWLLCCFCRIRVQNEKRRTQFSRNIRLLGRRSQLQHIHDSSRRQIDFILRSTRRSVFLRLYQRSGMLWYVCLLHDVSSESGFTRGQGFTVALIVVPEDGAFQREVVIKIVQL